MTQPILQNLHQRKKAKAKSFAVLIDPDKVSDSRSCLPLINRCIENQVDFFLVGGSLITTNNFNLVVAMIKEHCEIPVIIFPGNTIHIDPSADAILFLSLISGRNPELLIGQHVHAAPILKRSNLEIISTGYMLIDSGNHTTVSYISNTSPIPSDKHAVAACTAMAGEMLGLSIIYLDAGSGAEKSVPEKVISSVRRSVDCPLIVGGGINSGYKATLALSAGADVIVVGNGIEKNQELLIEVSEAITEWNQALDVH